MESFLQISEAYNDFDPPCKTVVTSMGVSDDKPLVGSLFGKVQISSVLSYQHPKKISNHQNATPFPCLPIEGYRLNPSACVFVCTEYEQLHLRFIQITFDMAHKIEDSIRELKFGLVYTSQA